MTQPPSPYEVLGIQPRASDDDIRTAYRRAAKAAHPDRNGGDHARMAAVNLAYEKLSAPRDGEHRAVV